MDNFMSKLSQKLNAQDMIKVNFMADTAEKEQMKKQLKEYEAILQGMRSLYTKQEENNEAFAKVVEQLSVMQQEGGFNNAAFDEIKECLSKSDEFTHKESVKVYRNVQALLDEQDKKTEQSFAGVERKIDSIVVHDYAENFYALEMSDKQIRASVKSNKVWLVLLTLVSIANLACTLLIHFGIF